MRKELRKQIELLEQKMSKSPNSMRDGGSHFLYSRERMIRFKMLQKNMPQKCLQKDWTWTRAISQNSSPANAITKILRGILFIF